MCSDHDSNQEFAKSVVFTQENFLKKSVYRKGIHSHYNDLIIKCVILSSLKFVMTFRFYLLPICKNGM